MESRFENLETSLKNVVEMLNKLDKYKAYCSEECSKCDKVLTDLDHKLELQSLDAVKMIKLTVQRKRVLRDRRYWKDEIEYINSINSNSSSQEMHNKLKSIFSSFESCKKNIDERIYVPRFLFEGWDDEPEELKKKATDREKAIAAKKINQNIKRNVRTRKKR